MQDILEISDVPSLAAVSGIEPGIITSLAFQSRGRYREFQIVKANGGLRSILAPLPQLLAVQRAINKHILRKINISPFATAYIGGKSITDHVKPHLGSRDFVKIDIQDYFPSIRAADVRGVFRSTNLSDNFAYLLANLCCHEDILPQGAPTSPAISNIVATRLDHHVSEYALSKRLRYTRYADDLLISGDRVTHEDFVELKKRVQECGFTTNSKSKLARKPRKFIACGISISTGEMRIPKSYKRELRKEAFLFVKQEGMISLSSAGTFDPFYGERLIGKLQFWKMIETNSDFANTYIKLIREKILHLEDFSTASSPL